MLVGPYDGLASEDILKAENIQLGIEPIVR